MMMTSLRILLCSTCISMVAVHGQFINETECGIVPDKPTKDTPLDSWNYPWLAAIGFAKPHFQLESSGALISRRHVLTSRLRFHNKLQSKQSIPHVRLGDYDYKTDLDGVTPVDYVVIEVITPEGEFDPDTYENDIAILVLDRDVQFNKYIQPICLPEGLTINDIMKKKLPVTSYGHYLKNIKIELSVPYEDTATVLHQAACIEQFNRTDVLIDERYFCAGVVNLNSCYGEIGGPVQYKNPKTDRWTVVGLLAVAYACDTSKNVADVNVITNVMEFLPFIRNSTTLF